MNEDQFVDKIKTLEGKEKYQLLQDFIDHIKSTVSPRVTRNYFDNIFLYFLLNDLPLDYTQKKLKLKFPRISENQFEGLDVEKIKLLLSFPSENFRGYMSALFGGGLRETEGLKLTPSMIKFEEYPVRIKLPGEITKFKIPRETFLPGIPAQRIKELIESKGIKDNETIFLKNWNERSLEDFEEYFAKIRTKAGLDTPNRKKNQKNDISLHSCRAFFITTFTDKGLEAFGHALTGHTRYMKTYYRKSIEQRRINYLTVAPFLDF